MSWLDPPSSCLPFVLPRRTSGPPVPPTRSLLRRDAGRCCQPDGAALDIHPAAPTDGVLLIQPRPPDLLSKAAAADNGDQGAGASKIAQLEERLADAMGENERLRCENASIGHWSDLARVLFNALVLSPENCEQYKTKVFQSFAKSTALV
jgi:hypothetical protein